MKEGLRVRPRRLVVVGTVLVDIVLYLDVMPEPGSAALARDSVVSAGAGYNLLAAATRLGLPAACAGKVGGGLFGTIVQSALAELRVPMLLPLSADDTGFDVALVTSGQGSQPTFIGRPGAESRLTSADLELVALSPADAVYVSGYDLWYAEAGAALAEWVATLGPEQLFVFDPGPVAGQIDQDRVDAALRRADVLSLNMAEAAALTGGSAAAAEMAMALAARLPAAGWVIVRAGQDGCWVTGGGRPPRHVPGRPALAVDPAGAGDAHVAALVSQLARGEAMMSAARWANVAASLAVARQGPATGPTAAELTRAVAESEY